MLSACNRSDNTIQGYIEGELVYLSSPVGGEIAELKITRGDKITQGQMVAKLVDLPEVSQLHSAKAQATVAESELKDIEKGERSTIIDGIVAQIKQAKAEITLTKQRLIRFSNTV